MEYLERKGLINKNFIIVSTHSFDNLVTQKRITTLNLDGNKNYQDKDRSKWKEELIRKIKNILGRNESVFINKEKNKKNDNGNNGDKKMTVDFFFHYLIKGTIFLAIFFSLIYALKGIVYKDFYKGEYKISHKEKEAIISDTLIFKIDKMIQIDSINHIVQIVPQHIDNKHLSEKTSNNEVSKLVFIEHIFLYLLPLFIVLGFYEYYRLTLGVLLSKQNPKDYNPKGAMTSLSNSKIILLSSILSFTLTPQETY